MSTQNFTSRDHVLEYIAWNTPYVIQGVTRRAQDLGVAIGDSTSTPYLSHITDGCGLRRMYRLVIQTPEDAHDEALAEDFARKLFRGYAEKV